MKLPGHLATSDSTKVIKPRPPKNTTQCQTMAQSNTLGGMANWEVLLNHTIDVSDKALSQLIGLNVPTDFTDKATSDVTRNFDLIRNFEEEKKNALQSLLIGTLYAKHRYDRVCIPDLGHHVCDKQGTLKEVKGVAY